MRWEGLRDYQREALEKVAERRVARGIVAIATGGGKGHIAGHIAEALGTERILYMVHRDKLVDQLEQHVRRVARGFVGVEQASRRAGSMASTVVASVQTLAAGGGRRLKALLERGFDALVTDEVHHAVAASYCRIQAEMGLLEPGPGGARRWLKTAAPSVCHVGLTATPGRGDGVGLHLVFDEIIFKRDLRDLVRAGWLVPPVAYTIHTATSLDEVRTLGKGGDYLEGDLERAVNNEERHDAIFDGWSKAARGTRTLAFCVTIAHAKALASHFRARGVQAWEIHGEMSRAEQESIYRDFAATSGSVLANCQIVGEGVDLPHVETVLMARPTRSATVYAQAIGRGTRLAAGARDFAESVALGKATCLVLDVTDSVAVAGRRGMTIGRLVGLPWPDEVRDGAQVLIELDAQERLQREQIKIRDREASLTSVKLIDSSSLPRHFGLRWLQAGGSYLLPLPGGGVVRIATDTLDRWAAERQSGAAWEAMSADPDQAAVVSSVERWYRETYPETVVLADRGASWRSEPVTQAQRGMARRLGVRVATDDTRGRLSDRIDAARAARGEDTSPRPQERPAGPGPCPRCGRPTRAVEGKYGAFFGCIGYPECRGTRMGGEEAAGGEA